MEMNSSPLVLLNRRLRNSPIPLRWSYIIGTSSEVLIRICPSIPTAFMCDVCDEWLQIKDPVLIMRILYVHTHTRLSLGEKATGDRTNDDVNLVFFTVIWDMSWCLQLICRVRRVLCVCEQCMRSRVYACVWPMWIYIGDEMQLSSCLLSYYHHHSSCDSIITCWRGCFLGCGWMQKDSLLF